MAHRALIVFVSVVIAACNGQVEEPATDASSQSQSVENEETKPPCDPPPPPPAPPPKSGGKCGACIDEHFVCCSAPEPCAGFCVPDCRPAPERCPANTACDQGSGVCLRQ